MFTPQTCHMSCVRCHVSGVTCNMSHVTFFLNKWWSYSVEGLLSMGPTPSSFVEDKISGGPSHYCHCKMYCWCMVCFRHWCFKYTMTRFRRPNETIHKFKMIPELLVFELRTHPWYVWYTRPLTHVFPSIMCNIIFPMGIINKKKKDHKKYNYFCQSNTNCFITW